MSLVFCIFILLVLIFSCLTLSDYGVDSYDIGAGFGHFGIAVEDVIFCI
jgi:hypothetical protein